MCEIGKETRTPLNPLLQRFVGPVGAHFLEGFDPDAIRPDIEF